MATENRSVYASGTPPVADRGNPVSESNSSCHAANATSLAGQKNSISSRCSTTICQSPQASLKPNRGYLLPRSVAHDGAVPHHDLTPGSIILHFFESGLESAFAPHPR
jgi:hypothetical protein